MHENKLAIIDKRIEKTVGNLKKNNMDAYVAENGQQAVELVEKLLNEGDTITIGGSKTLEQAGVLDHLRCGRYNFLDRYKAGITNNSIKTGNLSAEVSDIYRAAFTSDAYLCSSNAITENGEIYNVDGNSNRVAAILFGPKSVIIVAGYNKIVRDIDEAVLRVKTIAAPANCVRLSSDTYCREKGECVSFCSSENAGKASKMASGCDSDSRICCNYVVSGRQRHKNRIKVILVKEDYGY